MSSLDTDPSPGSVKSKAKMLALAASQERAANATATVERAEELWSKSLHVSSNDDMADRTWFTPTAAMGFWRVK